MLHTSIRCTGARASARSAAAAVVLPRAKTTPIAPRRRRVAASAAAGEGPSASPFASASVHRKVGEDAAASSANFPPLSVEAVDACLDEVRPYLIADGGDVEVVSAQGAKVELRLRGACSSCASSDATMRMGLERAIRARFGPAVEVAQVSSSDDGSGGGGGGKPASATVEAVDGHLNVLRNAVAGLGGRVKVVALEPVEGGQRAKVWYSGPRSIGNGIKAAILERFPGDVVEVDMVDFPEGQ
jgi:Fe-S cluster biogenesis protein NfuA